MAAPVRTDNANEPRQQLTIPQISTEKQRFDPERHDERLNGCERRHRGNFPTQTALSNPDSVANNLPYYQQECLLEALIRPLLRKSRVRSARRITAQLRLLRPSVRELPCRLAVSVLCQLSNEAEFLLLPLTPSWIHAKFVLFAGLAGGKVDPEVLEAKVVALLHEGKVSELSCFPWFASVSCKPCSVCAVKRTPNSNRDIPLVIRAVGGAAVDCW